MGRQTGNGGVIVFVPGGRGQQPETFGAGKARRGETLADTVARVTQGARLPGNARVFTLDGDNTGTLIQGDTEITEILSARGGGRRLVDQNSVSLSEARRGGTRLAREATRAQVREANAPRRAARAAAAVAEAAAASREANARVRRLQSENRSARTIRSAENQAARLREALRDARAAQRATT